MAQFDSSPNRLLVAIDGGGSKVAGAIASYKQELTARTENMAVIRRSTEGTGSASTVTWETAKRNLIGMFESLLNDVSAGPENVSNVVLMLAGAGRREDVTRVTESLTQDSLFGSCKRLTVTSDIQPLLFEARDSDPNLPSIVVIAGTGSLVASLDAKENVVRAGGWGPVLGDEGSGWGLAHVFLKTICAWIDSGRDVESTPEGLHVLISFLTSKQLSTNPQQLNSAIIQVASDRHLAAQLAPSILELATQPSMSTTYQLVMQQIELLANQVQQVHQGLAIKDSGWRLCLAGGLASTDTCFQTLLTAELKRRAIAPASISVLDPLTAALHFAANPRPIAG